MAPEQIAIYLLYPFFALMLGFFFQMVKKELNGKVEKDYCNLIREQNDRFFQEINEKLDSALNGGKR